MVTAHFTEPNFSGFHLHHAGGRDHPTVAPSAVALPGLGVGGDKMFGVGQICVPRAC